MELTGPAVEAALNAVAEQIAADRPTRILWMLTLPGLTGPVLEQAAKDVGLLREANGTKVWPKLAEVSGERLEKLKAACERLVGYAPERGQLTGYGRWKEQLMEWQVASGIDPNPEKHNPFPAALRERIRKAVARLESERPPA